MKKFSQYARDVIDEVQAITTEFRRLNPTGSDEALARMTETTVRMIYDAGEEVFD
jgi:hypothetical protein